MRSEIDTATLFFENIFGDEVAKRIMSGILALSLFGNIVVATLHLLEVSLRSAPYGISVEELTSCSFTQ